MSFALINQCFNLQLSTGPKLVLLAMCAWADEDGICWPSMESIARRASLSKRQAQRVMHDLIATGWIEVVGNAKGGRRSRRYKINVNNPQKADACEDAPKNTPSGLPTPCRHLHPTHDNRDTPPTTLASPEKPLDPSLYKSTRRREPLSWPTALSRAQRELVQQHLLGLDSERHQKLIHALASAYATGNKPRNLKPWLNAVGRKIGIEPIQLNQPVERAFSESPRGPGSGMPNLPIKTDQSLFERNIKGIHSVLELLNHSSSSARMNSNNEAPTCPRF